MAGTRTAQPDREIVNIFAALNQEQQREKHDVCSLYRGRLRSHAQDFDVLKRKWEGFTGVPVPSKKLRTTEPIEVEDGGSSNGQSPEETSQNPAAKTAVKKSKPAAPARKAVASASARMPPHPDDKIDVNGMLVNDLRKELKKRQLPAGGRKVELQTRLRGHLAEAKEERESRRAAKCAVAREAKAEKEPTSKRVVSYKSNLEEMDVVMEDAEDGADGSFENGDEDAEPTKKDLVEDVSGCEATEPHMEVELGSKEVAKLKTAPAKVSGSNNQLQATQKHAPKSALKPSKYVSSSVQGAPQIDGAKFVAKPASTTMGEEDLSAPKQLLPTKISESSAESSVIVPSATAKSAKKTKISSTLAQTTPIESTFKAKAGAAGSSSAKLLEQKKKAHAKATEARMARLAEMRQKAKEGTAASASSATKAPSSHSKYAVSSTLKKMATKPTPGGSKSNDILAKMRQKAAAEKGTENALVTAPAANPTKPAKYVGSTILSSPSMKRVPQTATSQPGLKSTALKSLIDPANRPSPVREEETKPVLTKPELKPLSPPQTYEMSDREEDSDESDSESDDEDDRQRPKKAVPGWAKKESLHRALERQFAEGPDRLDPDKIFGEVLTCNLEEIFDKKKSRYHKRTSSGNWSKDHVTLVEKLTYKRTMGYDNE